MGNSLTAFEQIVRSITKQMYVEPDRSRPEHPFEIRNLHSALPSVIRKLFDDGHYSQATFEAFKFVDKEVAKLANYHESGFRLMMAVFGADSPVLNLNAGQTTSEKDEQKGFQFLFAGSMLAIRNPRGHEYAIRDTPDECLDHLGLASILLRRLEAAGFVLK